MSSFTKLVETIKHEEQSSKILVLGLDNSGKTTLVKTFLNEDVNIIEPTLGFKIWHRDFEGHTLHLWDIGGQRSIRAFWKNYYDKADGLIWVIDSTDTIRFRECFQLLHSILFEERLSGSPCLILANKQDIEGAASADHIYEVLTVSKAMSESRTCNVQGISALTGTNVNESISWLLQEMKKD